MSENLLDPTLNAAPPPPPDANGKPAEVPEKFWDTGATTTRDVTLPGVRQGDTVHAGFAKAAGFQNGGVIFHAAVGGTASTDQVRVTAQNISGGSITVDAGTLYLRAVKPRL